MNYIHVRSKAECISILLVLSLNYFISINNAWAQNPFIRDQFSADPSARVFDGRVYVYPSHDILANEERGRKGWFCMEDYHVFSSDNLSDWIDHGVIVQQNEVPWVRKNSYNMWAPDCIYKNGKYYFYFPATPADTAAYGRGFAIGVAVSDKPEGPYVSEPEPIHGVHGIDPNIFTDKEGQSYLYWSAGNIYGAKLKENMLELATEPKILGELPEKGLKEGPYLFERNGIYYLTYPHVANKTERLEYATGDNPLGPFTVAGVIMDESPKGCWTNHQSIIEYRNQWYLFYHHNDYSPKFDKNRAICIDSLSFNEDGSIEKVIPTFRGVGITRASSHIQIDRYSNLSEQGAAIDFLDSSTVFLGWKVILSGSGSWVKYNTIDFGKKPAKNIRLRAASEKGGNVLIRLDGVNGKIIADVKIPASKDWQDIKTRISKTPPGIHSLVVTSGGENPIEVDWVSFE